jgi:hypothetical protein
MIGCYLLEYNINNKVILLVLADTTIKYKGIKTWRNFLITEIDI